jgi:hypothetical protein
MPQRRTPAPPSTRPLRTDDELHILALGALAERHGAGPDEALAQQYATEYDEIMRAFRGARRQRMAHLYPNVAAQHLDGQVLTVLKDDLDGESTADLVITLVHHLEMLTKSTTYDDGHAFKVAALWRELAFRGITLT